MDNKGKIAYYAIPESGGLFSFYLNLRRALVPQGWELHALCIGESAKKRWDASFADENCHLIAPDERDPKKSSRALAEWIDDHGIDIIIPMDSSVAASALPHIKKEVRLVTRCSTVSDFGFRICLLCPERLQRIVVMTPAQERRMLRYSGAEGKVDLIPHGVDLKEIRGVSYRGTENTGQIFRIVYIGRLEDRSKGVMYLPDIAVKLKTRGIPFELDIIGDGVDRGPLERRLARLAVGDHVRLLGSMQRNMLVERLNTVPYGALVMPSRYEGFPNAILEAMAAGIVPVASRLEGISDFIIEDRKNGMLCAIGNAGAFADAIEYLAADRKRWESMSLITRQAVLDRFSMERMGKDYDRMFNEVLAGPGTFDPRSWDEFTINRNYLPSWRGYLPQWMKNMVRRFVRI